MSNLLSQASLVMIPSGYKEDIVYSPVPTNGNGDLTFTRASNGTRVNSAGLVEVCPWNMLDESERFSNWNFQDTSVSSDSTTAPNGTTTADTIIESNTTYEHNRYLEPNIGGGVFTYSIYLKRFNTDWSALYVFNTAVGGVRHWVNLSTLTAGTSANIGSGIGTTSLSLESVGNGWVRASISFTNPSGSCRFYVANAQSNGGATSYAGNGTNGIFAWGAQVNIGSTAKPYFPTTDRLNVPRLTYQNGGGGCPSLLLEKQSTNYIANMNTSGWGASPTLTKTFNTTDLVSPDGTYNATKIVSTDSTDDTSNSYSVPDGSLTFSFYARVASGTKIIKAQLRNNSSASVEEYFTLTTTWQRFTLTNTVGGSGSSGATWIFSNGAGTFYVYGCQLEASSYATSLIPTNGTSATRVADACYKTGISSLIGQTEGTVFVDLNFNGEIFGLTNNYYIYIGNGLNTNAIYIDQYNNSFRWVVFDGTTLRFYTDVAMTTGRHKLALAYKNNDYSAYLDGTLITTQTLVSGAVPTCSQFSLIGNVSNFDNNVKQINQAVLFKTRLTNAELASLTTL